MELKFKFGKMQHFIWLSHDQFVLSCSNSGIVCVWNVLTSQRLYEYIEKKVNFTCLNASLNASKLSVHAIDRLNNIRILKTKLDKNFQSELDNVEDLVLEKLVDSKKACNFNNSDTITFAQAYNTFAIYGSSKGRVHFYDFNSDKLLPCKKTQKLFHNSSICQLFVILKLNQVILVSCSENGIVILSRLENFSSKSILDEFKLQIGWIDDILITKNEIVKKINYDASLKQSLFEQESEQKDKINLVEIIHKKQIKTINYEAKMNLTRLRTLLKELNSTNEERCKSLNIRVENFERKFQKILDFIKEEAEKALIQCYEFNTFLTLKHERLREANDVCEQKIHAFKSSESCIKQLNSKSYEELELEQECKLKLSDYTRICRRIKEENEIMELKEDESVRHLKTNIQDQLSFWTKSNEATKLEVCLAKKRASSLKAELLLLREREKNFNDTLNAETRRNLAKNERIDFLKRCISRKENEIEFDEKCLLSAKLNKDKLRKINLFQVTEASNLEQSIPLLKSQNEALISSIRACEEKLVAIVSTKIRLYTKLSSKSLFGYEKKLHRKSFQFKKKNFSRQQLKIKKLVDNLEKLNPNKKRLINKIKKML